LKGGGEGGECPLLIPTRPGKGIAAKFPSRNAKRKVRKGKEGKEYSFPVHPREQEGEEDSSRHGSGFGKRQKITRQRQFKLVMGKKGGEGVHSMEGAKKEAYQILAFTREPKGGLRKERGKE